MSDVLFADADDDVFWPPTDRTEAQAPEVATHPEAWAFAFLGSRVYSFIASPDRVVVFRRSMVVDSWALGPRSPAQPPRFWSHLPSGWEPRPLTMWVGSVVGLGSPSGWEMLADRPGLERSDLVEDPPADVPSAVAGLATVDAAVSDIKQWLGLTDSQVEAATGISRSTLWRLRTGRSAESRSTTDAPVWRLHAVAAGLTRALGSDGARSWLYAGDPAPADLLRAGHLGELEEAASRLLFREFEPARTYAAVADDDYDTAPPPVTPPEVRRARRARPAPRRPS